MSLGFLRQELIWSFVFGGGLTLICSVLLENLSFSLCCGNVTYDLVRRRVAVALWPLQTDQFSALISLYSSVPYACI